jgi:hypothetical protein
MTNTNKIPYAADYIQLTFSGRQYQSLDEMIPVVARAYAKRDFHTMRMLANNLKINLTDVELADQLIAVKSEMIYESISKKLGQINLFAA